MNLVLRREYAPLAILAVQAVLLAAVWRLDSLPPRMTALGLATVLGLWSWLANLWRHRAIADTPTSRIASAAQGYVELIGQGRPLPDAPLLSPMTNLPCLWYRYTLYKRVNDSWEYEEEGRSDLEFLLDDGSGRCLVDPAGAEVLSSHVETREAGDRRYTEHLLLEGDRLYILGQFISTSASHEGLDARQDLDDLLHEWKRDPDALRRRFDRDGDGQISPTEWSLAVEAARREVADSHRGRLREPIRHRLYKPTRGRFFLISDHAPDDLGRRYARWAGAHVAVLLVVLGAWAWLVHGLW